MLSGPEKPIGNPAISERKREREKDGERERKHLGCSVVMGSWPSLPASFCAAPSQLFAVPLPFPTHIPVLVLLFLGNHYDCHAEILMVFREARNAQ